MIEVLIQFNLALGGLVDHGVIGFVGLVHVDLGRNKHHLFLLTLINLRLNKSPLFLLFDPFSFRLILVTVEQVLNEAYDIVLVLNNPPPITLRSQRTRLTRPPALEEFHLLSLGAQLR